jgi:hypothetical protein
MKMVCSSCERVIAGPTLGIKDDDYEVPIICKACCNEIFEEGDTTEISEIYDAIRAKSRRYEN